MQDIRNSFHIKRPIPFSGSIILSSIFCLLTTTAFAISIEVEDTVGSGEIPVMGQAAPFRGAWNSPDQGIDFDSMLIQGLLRKGLWYPARDHALKTIRDGNPNITPLGTLALTAVITDDQATVNAVMEKLRGIDHEDYYTPLTQGVIELKKGKAQAAAKYFQTVLAKYPHDTLAQYFQAEVLNSQGKQKQALALLHELLQATPEFAPALVATARLESREQLNPRIIEMMEKAITIDPTNAAYRRRLAEMYENAGQHERARETLIALVKAIPGVKESYLNSAWQLLYVGNAAQALHQIDKSFELFGPSALGHLIRAMANIDLGNIDNIEQHLHAYLQSAEDKGQAHYASGLCHLALDKAQQAQRDFQAAQQNQANNIQALLNMAVTLQLQGEYKLAQQYVEQAEQGGEDVNILNFIRAHLELGRGNQQRYKQLLAKAKAIIPTREQMDLGVAHLSGPERQSIATLRNLSLIMLMNKWDNQALKLAERILEMNKNDPVATHFRQLIHNRRGE